MTKDQAILYAQRSANREGKQMTVWNLNMVGAPLYVVRDGKPEDAGKHGVVVRVYPTTIDQGG